MSRLIFFLILALTGSGQCLARGVYQEPAQFVSELFSVSTPPPRVIRINDALRQQLEAILDHPYEAQRIRYWQDGSRSVWILEETGKTKPITTGLVVQEGRIEQIRVLVFRESRGWEVRHAFFTNQFIEAGLGPDNTLDKTIDGISGATLSVRAVTKLARMALVLDRHIHAHDTTH